MTWTGSRMLMGCWSTSERITAEPNPSVTHVRSGRTAVFTSGKTLDVSVPYQSPSVGNAPAYGHPFTFKGCNGIFQGNLYVISFYHINDADCVGCAYREHQVFLRPDGLDFHILLKADHPLEQMRIQGHIEYGRWNFSCFPNDPSRE